MAKGGGRLWGLKSVVKRWCAGRRRHRPGGGRRGTGAATGAPPVYVGKSRRCYLVSSHLLDHPLFRVLVQRSAAAVSFPSPSPSLAPAVVVVGCEVVLFEHLLWMLQNGDPPPDSPEELADLYAC
ncbi:unnamed protein product [Spirodela intermedia]|uniref:Uncharacterized protein n=1 Tax=Spirodela intermedia TaxID=51605 RepID=A0A7I8J1V7_SPIIN|nr:unnamed protein product [Spirodela intermedia]CAA6664204.1 unnamed protein product [Spirodela intermedia]